MSMKDNFGNTTDGYNDLNDSFRLIFKLSHDAMFKIRRDNFKIIVANEQACNLYGYSNHDFSTMSILDLVMDKKTKELFAQHWRDDLQAGILDIESLSQKKDGTALHINVRGSKINDTYLLVTLREIFNIQETESLNYQLSKILSLRESQNQKLQLSKDILRMVVQHQPLNKVLNALALRMEHLVKGMRVAILMLEGTQLLVGTAPSLDKGFVEGMHGTEVGGQSLPCGVAVYRKEQIIVEDIATDPLCVHCRDMAKQFNVKACWSTPIISSDGLVLGTFAMYFDAIKRPDNDALDLIRMAIDLAEVAIEQSYYQESLTALNKEYMRQNKELELTKIQLEKDKRNLLDRERKLKEGQRLSKVGSWEFDFSTRILTWSEQQYRIYEVEPTQIENLYDAYQSMVHPEDKKNKWNEYIKARDTEGNASFKYEYRIITNTGQTKYILGIGKVEKDEHGKMLLLKGTDQDVTELKIAQNAVMENELKLNELMSNINEIVFIIDLKDSVDHNNPIGYINGDTVAIFGYTHEEFRKMPDLWGGRIHPDDLPLIIAKGKELHKYKKQVTREYRFKHKKGHYIWIEDNVSVGGYVNGEHTKLYGSARDITTRKRSEAALLESKERLQLATQAAKLGSYDWQVKENTIHWDERMYEMFELDPKRKVSNKRAYVMSIIHPDDKPKVVAAFANNLLDNKELLHFKNEYRIVFGERVKYIESYVIFFRDKMGRVERVIGTCLDVTERKEAEALLISNEEKDVLLKEIHHRVKNNLQVITSLLSLQSSYLANNEQKKLFADSQYRINSMAMVHEMLYQSDDLSKVDYQKYLFELSQFLIRSVKGKQNNVHLKLDVPKINLGIDTAIPLGLLINEVLTNSLKYGIKGDDEGTITIKIREVQRKVAQKSSFLLEIGDDGAGFSEKINFRNTKSLGLKLINNLTRQLEGNLKKDNTKKGTNYIICFNEI